jgi:hypothetical protein
MVIDGSIWMVWVTKNVSRRVSREASEEKSNVYGRVSY